jgi:hypothetical protein
MKATSLLPAVLYSLIFGFVAPALGEQPNRERQMPAYLKSFIPSDSFYSFHMQKGNIVFLQVSGDPATAARGKNWPGGCASSRIINLSTGKSYYIYEQDGSYFCSNYHHDVITSVQNLSAYSVEIGFMNSRCALLHRAVWNPKRKRYIFVKTRALLCDPK